jgi:hypothetical protein
MLKWIVAAIAVILLIAGGAWMNWRNSPMREIDRSSAAVENAKSWHYHTVRTYTGQPSNTFDKDTFCPVVVPQWFIHLSTYPQLVKQHCQLPSHSYHRSFLGILSSSFR